MLLYPVAFCGITMIFYLHWTKLSNSYFQLMAQLLPRSNRLDTTPSTTRSLAERLPTSAVTTISKYLIVRLCDDCSLLIDHVGLRACRFLAKWWILIWLVLPTTLASFYTRTTWLPTRSGHLSLMQFRDRYDIAWRMIWSLRIRLYRANFMHNVPLPLCSWQI